MAGLLIRPALRRSLAQIRHVTTVRPAAARNLVAAVYSEAEREFGMLAPPLALHSSAPESLAACWMMLRETLVATGPVDRATKETVAAAVSLANTCPYCVDVHSATLHGLTRGPDFGAIAEDRIESIADPALRGIALWARAGGARQAPFPAEQAPELVGVASTFHYLNRMVNVFLGESPIPPGLPAAARRSAVAALGRFMSATTHEIREPGCSLDLLPAARLPEDLSWAAGTPSIAGAFARAATVIDAAGARATPEPVRDLVLAELAAWNGRPTGLSRNWVDNAVSALPATERPAGRLALLVALASYQIDDSVIGEFRRRRPADATLIELTSWASMAAARQMGSRLACTQPPRPDGREST